jgi:hypothetical protein
VLARDDLDRFVRERGPRLFHASRAAAAEPILHSGLMPGSEIGVCNKAGFHKTRRGHVYLCERETAETTVEVMAPRALFSIDLRFLEPERINPDEDMVFFSWLHPNDTWSGEPHWIDVMPPFNLSEDQPFIEGPNGEGTLAYWAETTLGFDSEEITRKSLWRGRIAYQGTISPAALVRIG